MRLRISKSYLLFLIFFYLVIFEQLLEKIFPFLKYADEMISVAAIPIFLLNMIKRNRKPSQYKEYWWIFIWLFLIIGFIGNVFYQYQPIFKIALPDMLTCVKFWLAIYTGKNIFSHLNLEKLAPKIYFHIRLITWMYIVLIIMDQILHIFDSSVRYGLRSTTLFYEHSTYFVACCVFLIGILLTIRPYIRGYKHIFFLLLVIMCTTLRSKAFGAAFAFLFIYYVVLIRKKKISVRVLLLLIPIIFMIAWEQIEYYFFSSIQSDSARYQLLVKSIQVAGEHFPLGAGFGTFASYFSSVVYSPLYYKYNLYSVYGLRKGATYFISDSYWPMILGQTGWFGLIFMALALICLFWRIQKIRKKSLSDYSAGLCILIYLLISSVAESAFVNMLAIPLALWIGVLLRDSD